MVRDVEAWALAVGVQPGAVDADPYEVKTGPAEIAEGTGGKSPPTSRELIAGGAGPFEGPEP
jgi:hypothetical protein